MACSSLQRTAGAAVTPPVGMLTRLGGSKLQGGTSWGALLLHLWGALPSIKALAWCVLMCLFVLMYV